jgi:flagellar assembly protein FliH
MTKVIIKDSADAYRRWDIPVVEDVSAAVANAKQDKAPGLMTAEQIERIQAQAFKEAYDAGMQEGRQAGMAAAQEEIEKKSGMLAAMLQSLAQPLQQLDDCVEQELVSLSLAIARQLVRRELKADPAQVMGVVHEALVVLPVGSRDVKVCLHPEDVALVREIVASSEADRTWSLIEDPSLLRGDCRIVTATSQVDATLERRLAAIVSQLFGGERQQDAVPVESPERD